MKNGDKPASAIPHQDIDLNGKFVKLGSNGLTKREQFAAMAMQGLLSDCNLDLGRKSIAWEAVQVADALLKELDKDQS